MILDLHDEKVVLAQRFHHTFVKGQVIIELLIVIIITDGSNYYNF